MIIIGAERSWRNRSVTVCLVCRIETVYGVFVAVKIRQILCSTSNGSFLRHVTLFLFFGEI